VSVLSEEYLGCKEYFRKLVNALREYAYWVSEKSRAHHNCWYHNDKSECELEREYDKTLQEVKREIEENLGQLLFWDCIRGRKVGEIL